MDPDFFSFPSWQIFLHERFRYLKSVQPKFSARNFARRAGIGSPSYFQLVVDGRRRVSREYAERFAIGLQLDAHQTQCLLASIELESCPAGKRRDQLVRKLESLRKRGLRSRRMLPSHVRILSDPVNLKLYLLAQSRQFALDVSWLRRHLSMEVSDQSIGERIALLFDSGLWVRDGSAVKTIAPTVRTGDQVEGIDLRRMHENLLQAARIALVSQPADRRIVGSRTFLFDPKRLAQAQERIELFKQEMEAEFECLDGAQVYELHVSLFELEPSR
jgi:uncharacterized protein (TIGR02147 family)